MFLIFFFLNKIIFIFAFLFLFFVFFFVAKILTTINVKISHRFFSPWNPDPNLPPQLAPIHVVLIFTINISHTFDLDLEKVN